MRKFREQLVGKPDDLFDIETKIQSLTSNEQILERVVDLRKKLSDLPGKFFDLELDVTELTCAEKDKEEEDGGHCKQEE